MKVQFEEEFREEAVLEVARKMAIAARTAPKGKGQDNIVIAVIGTDKIKQISNKIKEMDDEHGMPGFFLRDADNILSAQAMVLLGTKIEPMRLEPCGYCGFKNCEEKEAYPDHPCAFNTGDLGIAMGSAISIATDHRVDNRIMFTAGVAAIELDMLGEEVKIAYGIPLSVGGKNPFFDRKKK
jgi:uncharacterized ferredoxin-like protein